MAMSGRRDRAGRLLTNEQRMLAEPNSAYWEERQEDLIDDLKRAGFTAWDDIDAMTDAAPADVTRAGLYYRLKELAKPYLAPKPQEAQS
jgi:hypothetical protein